MYVLSLCKCSFTYLWSFIDILTSIIVRNPEKFYADLEHDKESKVREVMALVPWVTQNLGPLNRRIGDSIRTLVPYLDDEMRRMIISALIQEIASKNGYTYPE